MRTQSEVANRRLDSNLRLSEISSSQGRSKRRDAKSLTPPCTRTGQQIAFGVLEIDEALAHPAGTIFSAEMIV
jgi:hypothetical protein